ncbi:transcription termination/antitermination NusG family protein [Sporosarcina beigongshangi]|uniref:transcription termination/antitermination NusG family protein n=1 Tax=Sporosarcina beigongshangi TaxID=2782538 RepID=UPI00193AC014|nr:transcription termination/antitermination NusG family protein [Sporosarcina beigongshangi]
MTYFVVQVRSGAEIEVKEMLNTVLNRAGDSMVKAIYAMETFTEIIRDDNTAVDLSELNTNDISEHLYVKRIQAGLNNLRIACDKLKEYKDANSLVLLETYKDSIRELSKDLREVRKNTKKISSVISGYILVELNVDFYYFPDNLWHLVKSVPNVTGIPSKYNVPQEEIDAFFQQIDITPEVEMQFEEILSSDAFVEARNEILHEANKVVGTVEEKVLLEKIDIIATKVVDSVNEMKSDIDSSNPIMRNVERCKAFIRRKRQTVVIPMDLFLALYNEIEIQNLIPAQSSFAFLKRFRSILYKDDKMVSLE